MSDLTLGFSVDCSINDQTTQYLKIILSRIVEIAVVPSYYTSATECPDTHSTKYFTAHYKSKALYHCIYLTVQTQCKQHKEEQNRP